MFGSTPSNVDILKVEDVLGPPTMRNIVQSILIHEGMSFGPQFSAATFATFKRMAGRNIDAIVDPHDDDHISVDVIVDLPRPAGHPLLPKWLKRS